MLLAIKGILFAAALVFAAHKDIKTREIPDYIPAIILAMGLIGFSPVSSFLGLILTGLPFFIAAMFTKRMGGGDIKLMAACGFLLGPAGGLIQTVIGLTAAVIAGIFVGKRGKLADTALPLAPFLGAGGIAAFIITNYGGLNP